jgi:hypothetical protein
MSRFENVFLFEKWAEPRNHGCAGHPSMQTTAGVPSADSVNTVSETPE